jgi:chemotaxis protein methyltransferase CheR
MNDATPATANYGPVIRLLSERTGLFFAPRQRDTVHSVIKTAMQRAGFKEIDAFVRMLSHDDRTLDQLISELTVGETYFFRELEQFRFIRSEILWELRKRRGSENRLRVWSAGCASGEEAYSLAMLFDREGLADRTHILATDICSKSLTSARQGVYHRWSLRGEAGQLAKPYLVADKDRFRIDERLRDRVQFEYLNLALDVYPSIVTGTWQVDLILCRNVLIYLDRDTVRAVARRLFESLAVGGWLITGSGDPPLGQDAPFETVSTDFGVFYRRPPPDAEEPAISFSRARSEPLPPETIPSDWEFRSRDAAIDQMGHADHPGDEQVTIDRSEMPATDSRAWAVALKNARRALADGEYRHAAELTQGRPSEPTACAIQVQALANVDSAAALTACAEAISRHPLSTELHYLHTSLLMETNQHESAAQAARRLIFLDRSLAIGHFLLGSALRRMGDVQAARRSFLNVRNLCARRPADEHVPLTDGESAGRLAEAAELQLAALLSKETR